MTNPLDPDCTTPKTGVLPFAPGELDRSGLRLTRAEFSRFLGVSKQTVGEWVTSGKITLGTDSRLDPRQAVSQLLRNTDPARLRAKVLEPLSRDIGRLQKRVADLEADLAAAEEDADFNEESAAELIEQQELLCKHLENDRAELEKLPMHQVIAAVIAWLSQVASGDGDWQGISILDCIASPGALEFKPEGDGDE